MSASWLLCTMLLRAWASTCQFNPLLQVPGSGNAGSYGDSDRFLYVEPSLHSRDKSHSVLVQNPFHGNTINFAEHTWCAAINIAGINL